MLDHEILAGVALLDESPEIHGDLFVAAHDECRCHVGPLGDAAREEERVEQRHIALETVDAGFGDLAQQVDTALEDLLGIGADGDLRDDDRVLGLELEVLAEIAVLDEAAEVHRDLLAGADDIGGRQVGALGGAAGERERLEQRRTCLDRIDSGLGDLADEIDAEAPDLLDHHRDVRVLDRRAQALFQGFGQLRHGHPLDVNFTGEGIRDLAIRAYDDVLLELFVVPHDDMQDVVDPDGVVRLCGGGGGRGLCRRRCRDGCFHRYGGWRRCGAGRLGERSRGSHQPEADDGDGRQNDTEEIRCHLGLCPLLLCFWIPT